MRYPDAAFGRLGSMLSKEENSLRFVIAYDVADDRLRDRMAELLEAKGERVQMSVFECRLDQGDMDRLLEEIIDCLGVAPPTSYRVRVYRLCEACVVASFAVGNPDGEGDRADWVL